ncbi:hypothetical protein E2C01_030621 [Portunus trituberculatus]|uniref:Uncharacterized protein n=1 Tax=Portunus trituberculatus TaxID=210409 RepID=A0A5B7EVB4_PORTR|nr:hypothetical protein [Portunus trituberculatus]
MAGLGDQELASGLAGREGERRRIDRGGERGKTRQVVRMGQAVVIKQVWLPQVLSHVTPCKSCNFYVVMVDFPGLGARAGAGEGGRDRGGGEVGGPREVVEEGRDGCGGKRRERGSVYEPHTMRS